MTDNVKWRERATSVVERAYRATDSPLQLLSEILRLALQERSCLGGSVAVQELGSAELLGDDIQIKIGAGEEEHRSRQPLRLAIARGKVNGWECAPILYRRQAIGQLCWAGSDIVGRSTDRAFFHALGRQLSYVAMRYTVRRRALGQVNRDAILIGISAAQRRLDRLIEKAASVEYPVAIEGEFGVEKLDVACAIHFASERWAGPFVEVMCQSLCGRPDDRDLADWLASAAGGTLFFNDIGALDADLLATLPRYVQSHLGQWLGTECAGAARVRILVSTRSSIEELVAEGRFSRRLGAELGFLRIEVPPLMDRTKDIRSLIAFSSAKYGDSELTFDDRAVRLLEKYRWPGNRVEFERVMAHMRVFAEGTVIGQEEVRALLPELCENMSDVPEEAAADAPSKVNLEPAVAEACEATGAVDAPAPTLTPEEIAARLLSGDLACLERCHPRLRRALLYISDNFTKHISLTDLARQAFLSSSHLCYLFKTTIGCSFKPFLGMVRIEQAKGLLVEQPKARITDIAFNVGFGDLSHFEKTFRNLTGTNAREYRRRHLVPSGEQPVQSSLGHG